MPVLEAPITAVTVYNARARIIRTGKITLEPGEQTLILDALPHTLEADSVRVSGTGTGVTLLGVDIKDEVVHFGDRDAGAALRSRIQALYASKKVHEDKLAAITTRLEMLKNLADESTARFGKTLASGQTSVDKVTELSEYVEQQLDALQARQREVQEQIYTITGEIDLLVKEGQTQQPVGYKTVRQLHVPVRAAAAVEFTLEIAYIVSQAWWTPVYDVRLDEANQVELTYMATVKQMTGEDWNNVDIALSTARPALSIGLPELKPWYLTDRPPVQPRYREQRRDEDRVLMDHLQLPNDESDGTPDFNSMSPEEIMKWMESLAKRQGATEGYTTGADMAEQPRAATIPTAQVSTSGAAVTYQVGTPVTIPSDGSPHKTSIVITKLSAKLDYLSVPKYIPEAYLRATITNTSEYTLLPGQASIFHGDEFVGKTVLATTAPNEEFEVQLGVDDRIKIERKMVNREVSKRFIGNLRRIVYAYQITVTNLLPAPAKITISDGIPVSQHESIRVQREKISPEPTEQTELNILSWTFELAAGAKQDILLSFSVEHGRNITVVGLVE